MTLPNVVTLLLETSEGRKWIINEHEKIINDLEHRYQTRRIEGFVYEGGILKWLWWKLFGNEEQYYTSGYQNRIAEIVAHIKEEDAEKEQEQLEQEKRKKIKITMVRIKKRKPKKNLIKLFGMFLRELSQAEKPREKLNNLKNQVILSKPRKILTKWD